MDIKRFFTLGPDHQFIFGPRGTGKSTFLKHLSGVAVFLNLLETQQYRKYLAHPEHFRDIVPRRTAERVIVIVDEVQKVPRLTDEVHNLIEDKSINAQFILTGSSARKLKRDNADMLAGRAEVKSFHPFMAAELGTSFDLTQALLHGTIPVIFNAANRKARLNAYISAYIQEEVQLESLVRNLAGFERFLETMSFCHATTINLSNIAREAEIGRSMVENYVEILEDLLLGYRLRVFEKKPRRETTSHPKFYFFDPGLFMALRPKGPLDDGAGLGGAALEGLVAEHLRAWLAYSGFDAKLYFWRTRGGSEVDFVVYGEKVFFAIEVKNSLRLRASDLNGLEAFLDEYPQAQPFLLYRGSETLYRDRITVVNVEEFLQRLTPGVWQIK